MAWLIHANYKLLFMPLHTRHYFMQCSGTRILKFSTVWVRQLQSSCSFNGINENSFTTCSCSMKGGVLTSSCIRSLEVCDDTLLTHYHSLTCLNWRTCNVNVYFGIKCYLQNPQTVDTGNHNDSVMFVNGIHTQRDTVTDVAKLLWKQLGNGVSEIIYM